MVVFIFRVNNYRISVLFWIMVTNRSNEWKKLKKRYGGLEEGSIDIAAFVMVSINGNG